MDLEESVGFSLCEFELVCWVESLCGIGRMEKLVGFL